MLCIEEDKIKIRMNPSCSHILPLSMFNFAFDLDGTLVDSRHRQHHNSQGLCIDHWRRNSTPESIEQDKRIENVFELFQNIRAKTNQVKITTSRVLSFADYDWLIENLDLCPYKDRARIKSRKNDKDFRPDPILKHDNMIEFCRENSIYHSVYNPIYSSGKYSSNMILFEDREDVIEKFLENAGDHLHIGVLLDHGEFKNVRIEYSGKSFI